MSSDTSIWWSQSLETLAQEPPPSGIGDDQLLEWVESTVGWHAVEITPGAFQCCGAHPQQTKALVLAALEAASKQGTRTCRFAQIDVDVSLAKCITVGLQAYSNVQKLMFVELNVLEDAVVPLSDALAAAEHLQTLSLSYVHLSVNGWGALSIGLQQSPSLRKLKFRHTLTSLAVTESLCASLRVNTVLRTVDVSRNDLQDAGMKCLCEALSVQTSVCSLYAALCGYSAPAAASIAAMLKQNKTLTSVNFADNDLGYEGCAEVCKSIGLCPTLVSVDISGCRADDGAAEALSRSLQTSTTLTVLKLRSNRIGEAGVKALAWGLRRSHRVLRSLDLSGNCMIGDAGATSMAELIKSQLLGSLHLADCELSDAGAFALGSVIRGSASLTQLDLSSNHITQNGISMFAGVLLEPSGLRFLDLSYNWVGPRAAACLKGKDGAAPKWMPQSPADAILSPFAPFSGGRVPVQVVCEILPEFRQVEDLKYSAAYLAEEEHFATTSEGGLGAEGSASGRANREDAHAGGTDAFRHPGEATGATGVAVLGGTAAAWQASSLVDNPFVAAAAGPLSQVRQAGGTSHLADSDALADDPFGHPGTALDATQFSPGTGLATANMTEPFELQHLWGQSGGCSGSSVATVSNRSDSSSLNRDTRGWEELLDGSINRPMPVSVPPMTHHTAGGPGSGVHYSGAPFSEGATPCGQPAGPGGTAAAVQSPTSGTTAGGTDRLLPTSSPASDEGHHHHHSPRHLYNGASAYHDDARHGAGHEGDPPASSAGVSFIDGEDYRPRQPSLDLGKRSLFPNPYQAAYAAHASGSSVGSGASGTQADATGASVGTVSGTPGPTGGIPATSAFWRLGETRPPGLSQGPSEAFAAVASNGGLPPLALSGNSGGGGASDVTDVSNPFSAAPASSLPVDNPFESPVALPAHVPARVFDALPSSIRPVNTPAAASPPCTLRGDNPFESPAARRLPLDNPFDSPSAGSLPVDNPFASTSPAHGAFPLTNPFESPVHRSDVDGPAKNPFLLSAANSLAGLADNPFASPAAAAESSGSPHDNPFKSSATAPPPPTNHIANSPLRPAVPHHVGGNGPLAPLSTLGVRILHGNGVAGLDGDGVHDDVNNPFASPTPVNPFQESPDNPFVL